MLQKTELVAALQIQVLGDDDWEKHDDAITEAFDQAGEIVKEALQPLGFIVVVMD
jgi:hypothetical protein